jgi:DNA-binding transcriptional LysR family regulator
MDLLSQMATFVRVVEGGSLSAAARASHLSLPAVSRQLRTLEEDLGAPLVLRSTRRLSVTDAGRRWYEHCVRALREVEEGRTAVRATRGARGTLVVSAPVTLASLLVLPRLPRLVKTHPELAVDLRLEDQFVDLVAEGVDVAVRGGAAPPDSTAFVAHPLLSFSRHAVASPAYLRKRGTPRDPTQLARHECLVQLGGAGPHTRWSFTRGEAEHIVEVRGRLRANAPLALRDLARAGLGIALLPTWLTADDVAAGSLRALFEGWSGPSVTAWAIYRAELRGSARIRAFLEAMPSA